MVYILQLKDVRRNNVDSDFKLSLGGTVNNNKCRVYEELGVGVITCR